MNPFRQTIYSQHEVNILIEKELAVDGSKGGLILGRSHKEGGVPVIKWNGVEYERNIEVEGYEYLFSSWSSHLYLSHLGRLNTSVQESIFKPFRSYTIPSDTSLIDARLESDTKAIIIGLFKTFIVRRSATKKYLKTLDLINKNVFMDAEEKIFYYQNSLPLYIDGIQKGNIEI